MERSEMNLGYLLNKATHLIKWEINKELEEYQLTSAQWAVLADVFIQEVMEKTIENTTPALIAERLRVERPSVTRIVDKLILDGWVSRLDNPNDRRSQLIILTDKAKELIPHLEMVSNRVIEKTFVGFKEGEKNQLRDFLIRIINNLDE